VGAAGANPTPRYLSREVMYSMLAMDSIAFSQKRHLTCQI
jgi:hypothetical protein